MLRHILLLKPKPETHAEAIEAARSALAGLVGQIPGLIDFHWGVNIGPAERSGGFEYGFSMDFADKQSLEGYGPHPEHVKAAALVRAAFTSIVVFDFVL
jgi:hypothetical protein